MSRKSQVRAFSEVGLPLFLLVGGGFYGLTRFLDGLFEIKVGCSIFPSIHKKHLKPSVFVKDAKHAGGPEQGAGTWERSCIAAKEP